MLSPDDLLPQQGEELLFVLEMDLGRHTSCGEARNHCCSQISGGVLRCCEEPLLFMHLWWLTPSGNLTTCSANQGKQWIYDIDNDESLFPSVIYHHELG